MTQRTPEWAWIRETFECGIERYVCLKAGKEYILSARFNHNGGTWVEVWDDDIAAMIAAAPETAAECDRLREINAELLAALKGAINAIDASDDFLEPSKNVGNWRHKWADHAVEVGTAAIARAEGEDR